MIVDWTTVGQPTLHLTLEQEPSGNYIVVDARDGDTVYLRTPDLELCKRFMVAIQAKRQAVIDEDAYWWFQALAQHSVRVGALEGVESRLARGTDGGSAPSNVVPLKVCKDCGDRYINWGAHAERCFGRPARAKP